MAVEALSNFIYSQFFARIPDVKSLLHEDLSDKTYIVVGASAGLGLEAARHLYNLNAGRVILTARTKAKGETAKKYVKSGSTSTSVGQDSPSSTTVESWELDLDYFSSVQSFVQRVNNELPRVDGVLLNAGVGVFEYKKSQEGWEETLQVNFLSCTLLGVSLLPKILSTAETYNTTSRLSFVNSDAHIPVNLKNIPADRVLVELNKPENFSGFGTYCRSKLLQGFIVRELADKINREKVIINAVNPALCHSNIGGSNEARGFEKLVRRLLSRSTVDGATCFVHALLAGDSSHGKWLNNCTESMWSNYVRSEDGMRHQKGVYKETVGVLGKVDPEFGRICNSLGLV